MRIHTRAHTYIRVRESKGYLEKRNPLLVAFKFTWLHLESDSISITSYAKLAHSRIYPKNAPRFEKKYNIRDSP